MKKLYHIFYLFYLLFIFISKVNASNNPVADIALNKYNSGFKILSSQINQEIVLWYPSQNEERITSYWYWKGMAAQDGNISQGQFPLLIFSHGMSGSMYNQHYLAEFMARCGYIVAAINHNDDPDTLKTFIERPKDIKYALDKLLSNHELKKHIDINKIGMVGHSLGCYTSFVVKGGIPNLARHPYLCKFLFNNKVPCNTWLVRRLQDIYVSMRGLVQNKFHEKRIKAIVALAPGIGQVFENNESLSDVTIPVLIIDAEKDEIVTKEGGGLSYLNKLKTHAIYHELKGAGHYTFLPLCNSNVKKFAPEICYDPDPKISRDSLHKEIQIKVLDFFQSTLF